MNARELLTAAVLPALKRLAPEAGPGDLLLFGRHADASSSIMLKYGVDTDADMVYNIIIGTAINGCRLFSDVKVSSGYVDLTLSDEAIRELAAPYEREPLTLPDAPFVHGRAPDSVRARLIWAAAAGGGPIPPKEPLLRRAFLTCLFADTESSRQRALALAEEALAASRRARHTGGEALSPGAARVMAAALGTNKDKIPRSDR